MTVVRIPQPMQIYTQSRELVHVSGKRNVRQLIDELELTCPGIKDALVAGNKLKPDVAIMLDGRISQMGLLQPLSDENEIVFIPAIGGG